jgi:phosphatidate phosphatase
MTLQWWKVTTDLVVLVILGVLVVFLETASERGLYVDRGFFCDDETLRYPFSLHPAVPTWLLVLGCLLVPLTAIFLGNIYERFYKKRPECQWKRISLCRGRSVAVSPWLLRTLFHIRWFLIGGGITIVMTDIGKVTVGRLRPHFFSVCRPDFGAFNCTDAFGNQVYVTDYKCLGRDDVEDIDRVTHDSHLSFPSGHASASTYSFVFLLLYLASVRTFYHRSGLKLFLMLASLSLAILTSLSRISDHRHHPTDVLTGMALGAAVAAVTVFYFLQFLGHHKTCTPQPPTSASADGETRPLSSSKQVSEMADTP